MRLRRKPWIDEAIKEYTDILYLEEPTDQKGKWRSVFPHPENELHVEFGAGKGQHTADGAHHERQYKGILPNFCCHRMVSFLRPIEVLSRACGPSFAFGVLAAASGHLSLRSMYEKRRPLTTLTRKHPGRTARAAFSPQNAIQPKAGRDLLNQDYLASFTSARRTCS